MRRLHAVALALALILPAAPAAPSPAGAPATIPPLPATPERPVSRSYHGVTVVDPYEWLEHGGDPEVQTWTRAQDAHARAWLAQVPGIDWIRARVREVLLAKRTSFGAPVERLFATRFQPPAPQPVLVVMDGPAGAAGAKVVLDPAALDPTGATSFDWFVPSLDGTLVAASISGVARRTGPSTSTRSPRGRSGRIGSRASTAAPPADR